MDAKQMAATAIPTYGILKNFKFRWIVYGAVAYYGIRYLNQRGVMPKQTGFALGLFDKGFALAKRQMGLGDQTIRSNRTEMHNQPMMTH